MTWAQEQGLRFYGLLWFPWGLPWWFRICLQCRRPELNPWVWKIPWRREWQPTLVFLPGKSHGQRSLAGYSPWGRKKSDTTEKLTHLLSTECDQWLRWGSHGWVEECKLKTSPSTRLSCPNAALREGLCYLCRDWTGERLSPLDQYHLGAAEGHISITPSGSEKFCWAVEVTWVSYRLCKPGNWDNSGVAAGSEVGLGVFKPNYSLTEN